MQRLSSAFIALVSLSLASSIPATAFDASEILLVTCNSTSAAVPSSGGISSYNVLHASLEKAVGSSVPVVQTCKFRDQDWASYKTIVVALDESTSDVKALSDYVTAGKRVVMLGGAADSYFRSSISQYLLKLGSNSFNWARPTKEQPSLSVWHSDHPLAKGLPATIERADFVDPRYMLRVADTDARVAARNGDGYPLLLSKAIGAGVFVYYAAVVHDQNLARDGPKLLGTILGNAIDTPAAAFKLARKPTLLVETASTVPMKFSTLEAQLGADNIDLVMTDTWHDQDWDSYTTIVVTLSDEQGSLDASSIRALSDYVAGGKRVVMLGGDSDTTFHSAMEEQFLKLGSSSYDWTKVQKEEPSLSVWHSDHPLAKGLPATIEQADFVDPCYMLRVADTDARVAARNGDGYPLLLSKEIGTGGGVFVYYAAVVQDQNLARDGPKLLGTILGNAIDTPAAAFKLAHKPTLLVEAFDSGKPSQFSAVEAALGAAATDLLATGSSEALAAALPSLPYSTVAIAMNGDGLSEQRGADVAALAEYAAAGNRVVLLGGSCDEAFAAAMSSHVMSAVKHPGTWAAAAQPDMRLEDASHPLVAGWKHPDYNFSLPAASSYCVTPNDLTAWVALTSGSGDAVLTSMRIGAGVFVWYSYMPGCGEGGACYEGTDKLVLKAVVDKASTMPLDAQRKPVCGTPVDLVLVVDGSQRVSTHDFGLLRRFLPALGRRLDLKVARVGIVQYGSDARLEQSLTGNQTELDAVASGLVQLGGDSDLAAGLARAQSDLVQSGRANSTAKRSIVILSHGPSTGGDPVAIAEDIKKREIEIYSVGIGPDVDAEQLRHVASDKHYFETPAYNQLYKVIHSIAESSCAVCTGAIDAVILADDGAGTSNHEFVLARQFMEALVRGFDFTESNSSTARLGVVAFGDTTRTVIDLTNDEQAIYEAVHGISWRQHGRPATGSAIVKGQALLGKGSAKTQIMLLLTAGGASRGTDPVQAAKAARDAGVLVFALGIGNKVDAGQLRKIAGSKERVLLAQNFVGLRAMVYQLLYRACSDARPS